MKEISTQFNFYFPTHGEPISSQGTFENNALFSSATLKVDSPTL